MARVSFVCAAEFTIATRKRPLYRLDPSRLSGPLPWAVLFLDAPSEMDYEEIQDEDTT
jgi:hypothetical protein